MTDKPKRKFWQFHLSTSLLMTCVAGSMLYLNMNSSSITTAVERLSGFTYGWPIQLGSKGTYSGVHEAEAVEFEQGFRAMSGILDFKSSFEIENVSKDAYNCKIAMREQGWPLIWKLAVDVSVALAAVVGTAFISEFLVRRREARKTWATKSSENRSVQR